MISRLIEPVKNVVIAALLVSALFLVNETGLWEIGFSRETMIAAAPAEELPGAVMPAVQPVFAAVTSAYGERCGAKYDSVAVRTIYDRFGHYMREAFSLSDAPERVTEEQWRAALSGENVFFDFLSALPLRVLAERQEAPAAAIRMLCLAQEENLYLYYADEANGLKYRIDASSSGSISARIAEFAPDGALFAFEAGQAYGNLEPYVLICRDTPAADRLSLSNPLNPEYSWLFKLFDINGFLANHYREPDGAEVYVENDGTTLRVGWNGFVSYTAGPREPAEAFSMEEAIALARSLVANSIGLYCGAARTELSGVSHDPAAELYTLTFRYIAGGIPLMFADGGDAAVIQVSGGVITSARLRFREYKLAGDSEIVSQERQMAAAVPGGEQLLAYVDGGDSVKTEWVVWNG